MTRDQAVRRIKNLLGFRKDLDDEAVAALQETQEDAENGELSFIPWFLKEIARDTLLAGDNIVLLPTDFIREYEHERFAFFIVGYGAAVKVPYFASDGVGSFRDNRIGYYIDENLTVANLPGNKAYVLDTTFTEDIPVEYLYYKNDVELTEGNIENLWLRHASKWMIGKAGIKLAGVRNPNALNAFQLMQQEGATTLLRQDAAYRTGAVKFQLGRSEERNFDNQGDRLYTYNDTDLGI